MDERITVRHGQETAKPSPPNDWTYGWRYEDVKNADGTLQTQRIPLTPEEALHPKEEYVMSERTSHVMIATELRNMLRVWSVQHPEMTIFYNLIFGWDHPEIGDYAPDIAIVPNVREPEADRGRFDVAAEGTRPCFSPKTRSADKGVKLRDYARLGIAEYIYIDSRTTRRGIISEIVGHRLSQGVYQPIPIDEDGAVYCETLSLRIGILNGRVWVEDAITGRELLDHVETDRAYLAAEERATFAEERATSAEERAPSAEEQAAAEREARLLAERRVAELDAQIKALMAERASQ